MPRPFMFDTLLGNPQGRPTRGFPALRSPSLGMQQVGIWEKPTG